MKRETLTLPMSDIKLNNSNPRIIKDRQMKRLIKSIQDFPEMTELRPIVVDENNVILGGNMRYRAMQSLGYAETEVVKVSGLTDEQKREFIIKDNVPFGEWDWDELANSWDAEKLNDWGLDAPDKSWLNDETTPLSDDFIVPPLSILDTRLAGWKNRCQMWDSVVDGRLGRPENGIGVGLANLYVKMGKTNPNLTKGTSVFDPVLCELMYRWFNVEGGSILDPFAGGATRGVVAAMLGYDYMGVDLRSEQVSENQSQYHELGDRPTGRAKWQVGNSKDIESICCDRKFDMVFSCPPYLDLEKYSDDEDDLANMSHEQFYRVYEQIIASSAKLLKPNRFAVFVVGNVREKGFAQSLLVERTIKAFIDAGMAFYNHLILINPMALKAITCRKSMGTRKVGLVHQDVLVFTNASSNQAIKDNFPPIKALDNLSDEDLQTD